MTALAQIVLDEVDIELSVLGTLFTFPALFDKVSADMRPEWFSDEFARYMFTAMVDIADKGGTMSVTAIVAALPEQCGRMTRGQFFAHACAQAHTQDQIPALLRALKDRWARREIVAYSRASIARAQTIGESPFVIASELVGAMDTVTASEQERHGIMIDESTARVGAGVASGIRVKGVTTGIASLDDKLNGYVPGQLYVIAGRPGMGKSAFMTSSLRRTAQAGHGVALFSLEMTEAEIATRVISDALDDITAPHFGSIQRGLVEPRWLKEIDVLNTSLAGVPLYVDDSSRLTFAEIRAKARKIKSEFERQGVPLAVVCIDHMGLVTPSDRYGGNKVAEAGEVSGQARALAKELGCCVLLLCQLSREVEKRDDKRPIMSDLRWSGEIEQDAHVVAFLYREFYYLSQDAQADPYDVQASRNKLDFLIRKNRNGATEDVALWCSIAHSSIRDRR